MRGWSDLPFLARRGCTAGMVSNASTADPIIIASEGRPPRCRAPPVQKTSSPAVLVTPSVSSALTASILRVVRRANTVSLMFMIPRIRQAPFKTLECHSPETQREEPGPALLWGSFVLLLQWHHYLSPPFEGRAAVLPSSLTTSSSRDRERERHP